jgi:hypothetical protein
MNPRGTQTCVGLENNESYCQTHEERGTVNEKHIQNPVGKFGTVRVEGVDEQRDDPLVADSGADVHPVLGVVVMQLWILQLNDG